jgi:UDP-N-acetylglucosamine 2-epimerase (non-hydrolysing)
MKVAPILREMRDRPGMKPVFVHTGQHYDDVLSADLLRELGIPAPDMNLEVGSGTHAEQTARVMTAFEPVVRDQSPELVLVVGDVNSTVACALVAAKCCVPVAHVEAGLRSFDRRMPEEVNRVVTDALSDYFFTTEPAADENLLREGACPSRIFRVGNVMIDTLLRFRDGARSRGVPARLGLPEGGYGLVTLHRPENVDDPRILGEIMKALQRVAETMPLLFPVHPRTMARLTAAGLGETKSGLRLVPALGYLDFLALLCDARVVFTDSGGIQEETTVLGVPCLTLRENTERPITLEQGTNRLVGREPATIVREALSVIESGPGVATPPYWDGLAAKRIVDVLCRGVEPADHGKVAKSSEKAPLAGRSKDVRSEDRG